VHAGVVVDRHRHGFLQRGKKLDMLPREMLRGMGNRAQNAA
jgi:hypothetical protein